jgi:methylated-DNA-protein-cysteine methyltransferase-like protein
MAPKKSDLYEKIYEVVERVPPGKVATYGQIARVAGLGRQARLVGYALSNLPSDRNVPWHRVINAQGRISQGSRGEGVNIQRQWLEEEGVEFDLKGKVKLERFGWEGDLFPL